MELASIPSNEVQRLKALHDLCILDTPAEEQYDALVGLAASICEMPIGLVSLIDETRQWFKAKVGLDVTETSREVAFCSHCILGDRVMEVCDTLEDRRFFDNPLVTGAPRIRFYAGAPLYTSNGYALGSLCVIDMEPRQLTDFQRDALRVLANQVSILIEIGLSNRKLRESNQALDEAHQQLQHFFQVVAHDLRSPFNGIMGLTEILGNDFDSFTTADVQSLLSTLHSSASETYVMLEKLLEWATWETGALTFTLEKLQVLSLVKDAVCILATALYIKKIDLKVELSPDLFVRGDATMLASVIRNLTSNAIKFTPKGGEIRIQAEASASGVVISIVDNGVGMNPEQVELIESHQIAHSGSTGTSGERGRGIGLQLIHQFLEKHGARLEVDSIKSKGTTVRFCISTT